MIKIFFQWHCHSYLCKVKSYKYILTVLNLLQSGFHPQNFTEAGLVKVTNGSHVAKASGQLTISSFLDHPNNIWPSDLLSLPCNAFFTCRAGTRGRKVSASLTSGTKFKGCVKNSVINMYTISMQYFRGSKAILKLYDEKHQQFK